MSALTPLFGSVFLCSGSWKVAVPEFMARDENDRTQIDIKGELCTFVGHSGTTTDWAVSTRSGVIGFELRLDIAKGHFPEFARLIAANVSGKIAEFESIQSSENLRDSYPDVEQY